MKPPPHPPHFPHLVMKEIVREPTALLPEYRHEERAKHVHVPPVRVYDTGARDEPQGKLSSAHHRVEQRAGLGSGSGGGKGGGEGGRK